MATTAQEDARLLATVRLLGIDYLVGTPPAEPAPPVPLPDLFAALAETADDRLRHTLITLLLLHPECASFLETACRMCSPAGAEELAVLVLATLYLQRVWHLHLTLALGHPSAVPELPFTTWWQERHLPAPEVAYGEAGLLALEQFERHRQGTAYAYRSAWESALHHLIEQEHHHRPAMPPPPLSLTTIVPPTDAPDLPAAFTPVRRQTIMTFVAHLAQRVTQPYRLYLGTATALVMADIHPAATALDLHVGRGELPPKDVEQALRALRSGPGMEWVASSAADNIPLPSDWRQHTRQIFTEGLVQVDALEWELIALANIALGTSRVLADVITLFRLGLVAWERLDELWHVILPQMGHGSRPSDIDPMVVASVYQVVRSCLSQRA